MVAAVLVAAPILGGVATITAPAAAATVHVAAASTVAHAPAAFTTPALAGQASAKPALTAHERRAAHLHRLHVLHLRVLHLLHLARTASSNARARVVNAAKRYIGQWYSYGNLDCSGLTQRAYSAVGKHLPRTAAAQGRVGYRTSRPRPGDLVVWGSPAYHVGVYVGHARAVVARKTGTRVTIQAINWGHPMYRVILNA